MLARAIRKFAFPAILLLVLLFQFFARGNALAGTTLVAPGYKVREACESRSDTSSKSADVMAAIKNCREKAELPVQSLAFELCDSRWTFGGRQTDIQKFTHCLATIAGKQLDDFAVSVCFFENQRAQVACLQAAGVGAYQPELIKSLCIPGSPGQNAQVGSVTACLRALRDRMASSEDIERCKGDSVVNNLLCISGVLMPLRVD
jgi:hypothetical protein